jgi:hypothetical protein
MWTALAIAAAAIAALAAAIAALTVFGWLYEVRARKAFEATLTADERSRMRSFCVNGRSWRDYAASIPIDRDIHEGARDRPAPLTLVSSR